MECEHDEIFRSMIGRVKGVYKCPDCGEEFDQQEVDRMLNFVFTEGIPNVQMSTR